MSLICHWKTVILDDAPPNRTISWIRQEACWCDLSSPGLCVAPTSLSTHVWVVTLLHFPWVGPTSSLQNWGQVASRTLFPPAPHSPSASLPTLCWLRSCLLFWTTNTSLKWITPSQNLLPNFQQILLFSSCSLPPYPIPLCSPKSSLILNSHIYFLLWHFICILGYFDYLLVNIGQSSSFCSGTLQNILFIFICFLSMPFWNIFLCLKASGVLHRDCNGWLQCRVV